MIIDITKHKFLDGGGQMGKLIRAKDWSKTPLGPPETWPESLRTMVSVMMNNPFGMYIAWGKDYTQIYNDGYRPILANNKHPQALGISSKETFSEAWHIIGPMFKGVMEGEPIGFPDFMLPLNRNGQIENCFFDFAYSPIRIASGEVGGVLVTVMETTNKKKAEDALLENKKELEFVIETAQLGTFDYNPITNTLSTNKRLKQWFGLPLNEQIDLHRTLDSVSQNDKERVFNAINKVLEYGSSGSYDIEYTIENPLVAKPMVVHAKGRALFNDDKKAYRLTGTLEDVTERVLSRKKIEESEKKFRDSVQQAPLGIVIFRGPQNVIDLANDSYLKLIDKTEKQFVGKPLFESLPEVEASMTPIIAEVYKTGNAFFGYELPFNLNRHGARETGYYNFVYHPLTENNAISGIMVVATEVTATVKAKHLIEENEEKLKLIIEASDLGVYDVNLKTSEIVASERCYKILGFSKKIPLLHPDIIVNLHPDDSAIRKKAMQKAFAEGMLRYQARVLWQDQSIHWIDIKGKVFYDENAQPNRLLGTVRDITEERTFQQQLLEREEKFRLLADSMPQHVWTSDPDGNLNYWNQSVFDYSGLTLEQMLKDGWTQMVHPDDWEKNLEEWAKAIKTGEDFLIEHRFRKYDGNYRWQLSRAIPQKDADGNITMWVGSSTDIQEQKMFATELENMVKLRTNELEEKNIDLEKINKELQSFVYISSHDLQEPLRKIQTFSSRILETEYETLSGNAKKYFNRMQKSAFRMQNLIQDLITYSRTNVQELNFETVDLYGVIEEIKETLSEELEKSQVTFKLHNMCSIKVIPVQFMQIMHNLISNSIKFAKTDQPVVIEINCQRVVGKKTGIPSLSTEEDWYYHISYSDNGIGFEPQYRDKIFEVFQRLHSKDEYSGTGIGLAIVKKIIENHEGIIVAHGELNEGAKFDIYIPAH